MGDIGRIDFSTMAGHWLTQTGYPAVTATAAYNLDEETAEITVDQTGFDGQNPWIFPLARTLLTDKGAVVAEFLEKIDGPYQTFSVPCAGAFAVAVWNPGHAAYIRINSTASDDELYLQLKHDTDTISRVLAYQTLVDREMNKLCQNPAASMPSTPPTTSPNVPPPHPQNSPASSKPGPSKTSSSPTLRPSIPLTSTQYSKPHTKPQPTPPTG